MYLREINKFLALVCILRDYNFTRQALVDYNILCLHEAIHKIFSVRLSKKTVHFSAMNDSYFDHDTSDGVINGNGNAKQSQELRPSNSQLTNYLLNNKFRKNDS